MDFFAIILGLFFLIKGGEYLFDGSLAISLKLKIPKFVIGMTIVSFATSAPELVVSVKSALMGYPDLALGNIVGSNIANIAFVMGIVVLLAPIKIDKVFYKFDWPIMMLITLLFYFFLKTGNFLSLEEGLIMIAALIIYLFVILFFQKSRLVDGEVFDNRENKKYYKVSKDFSSELEGEWEAVVELKATQRKGSKRNGPFSSSPR